MNCSVDINNTSPLGTQYFRIIRVKQSGAPLTIIAQPLGRPNVIKIIIVATISHHWPVERDDDISNITSLRQ